MENKTFNATKVAKPKVNRRRGRPGTQRIKSTRINKQTIADALVEVKNAEKQIEKEKVTKITRHTYAQLLLNPFSTISSKLPKYSMGRTFSFRRVLQYTQALPNTNGCFIFIEPDNYASTAFSNSILLVDNGATYNPVTGTTTALPAIPVSASLNLNIANIDEIRLVACGARVWITDSALNLKGNLVAGVTATTWMPLASDSSTAAPQGIYTLPYLLKMDHVTAPLASPDIGIVYNYRQRSFATMQGHPVQTGLGTNPCTTDRVAMIATGFGATATLNVQIALHFECTVDPNGEYAEFPTYHNCTADPWDVISILSADPSNFLRTSKVSLEDEVSEHLALLGAQQVAKLPNIEPKYTQTERWKKMLEYK